MVQVVLAVDGAQVAVHLGVVEADRRGRVAAVATDDRINLLRERAGC